MKKNGNAAVNNIYNPTNKRPDMPLDADEVDNDGEIRKEEVPGEELGQWKTARSQSR